MPRVINAVINKLILWVFKIARVFMEFPGQLSFVGRNSSLELCQHIARMGHKRVLLVTDKMLVDLGLAEPLVSELKNNGTETIVYSGVLPDPTVSIVEEGLAILQQHDCDAVLALGGGSSIDAAKGIAASATNGQIRELIGVLKIKQATLPLFAIPSTAGTGSEVTIAAVISDTDTHEKLLMAAPQLMPSAVALDPLLTTGLPKHITAATGIDALTHAVETYIGTTGDPQVAEYSGSAVKVIFENLPIAYNDGQNVDARQALIVSSYYAGQAINIASVGNVHAISHQLGALYGTPHGLANAIVMPPMLDITVNHAAKPLAELAELIGVANKTNSELDNAQAFIQAIRDLNKLLGVPETLDALKQDDMNAIAKAAIKESLQYPVPKMMSHANMMSVLEKIAS